MEPSSRLSPDLTDLLLRGDTILTGNQRAARTLRLAFDRQRRADNLSAWQPPKIFAWDTWTANLWQQALLDGSATLLLLNRTQELHLWRSVISADTGRNSSQTVDSLAAMASAAWQLLCAYRGQSRLRTLGISEDTRAFQRWAYAFTRRCKTDSYLPQSELESALTFAVSSDGLRPASHRIQLVGFDSKTPAQAALIAALQSAGVDLADTPATEVGESLYLAPATTLDEELTQAALWLRSTLENNPEAHIAVIHPDIAAERGEIDRVFRHILAPELESVLASPADGPFEFSLGKPLAHAPMVEVALTLLRWVTAPLPVSEISRLLLSPWFTPSTDLHLRAEFDAFELRRASLLRPELSIPGLLRLVRSSRLRAQRLNSLIAQLNTLLRASERIIPDSTKQRPYADWADTIRELVHSASWARLDTLSSTEFQTRRKWEAALDELASLDFEGTRPAFPEALSSLEAILQRTLFAPESRDAPIQIMSPQEAAGSRFDALYFLRCSDLTWPTSGATNPLLGWALQRDLGIPGSTPAHDTAHTAAVTMRLASSAPIAVFSYAKELPDCHQRPSALLASLALQTLVMSTGSTPPSGIELEEIEDPGNLPLARPKLRGGSSILKLQAGCGFRAFAEARLWSTPLDTPEPGLDAGERGSIVHATMACLWNELRSQAALRALTFDQRRATLDRAITHALKSTSDSVAMPWDAAYVDIQRERLHRLIGPWLDQELERPPFEVKASEQQLKDRVLGPLMLDIRLDRVDTLLDLDGNPAGEVILDYKTGDARPAHWLGERPDDPQLPLYAVLSEPETLAGVGFVRLRAGKHTGLQGFADSEGILPKPHKHGFPTLEAQIEDWRNVLTALAEDFASGNAGIRPKAYPHTCTFCAQRILCRVDPALLEDDHAEDPDQAAGDASDA